MSCSGEKGKYLSYKCYSSLEKFFEGANLSDDGQAAFDSTIEKIKGSPYINSMDKFIRDIAKFLTSDTAFSFTGYDVSCMYMNFWLNKQVKNSYNDEYKSIFIFFDDFASKFAKERENKNSKGYSCENHINELVGDEYRKNKILYRFYDLYNEFKTPKTYKTDEQLCDNINLIHMESLGANVLIEQDVKFAELLKQLKILIQNDNSYKEKCKKYKISNFILPDEIPQPKLKEPVMPVNKSVLPVSLPIPQHQNLKHEEGDMSHNVQNVLSVNEEFPQITKSHEVASLAATTPPEESQELGPLAVLAREPSHNTFPEVDRLDITWPQAGRFLEHDRESPRTHAHSFDDTQDIRSQTGGVLGSIQNTLTEVLGSVEPAPVLGVSGGMGALFLLFKYTPVGTFFRGRRGRTHGIPSGFNGPFSGVFAGYEDYYGGNVGNDQFHISYQAKQ